MIGWSKGWQRLKNKPQQERTDDKEGYAKALGKPILLIGVGISVAGITAVVLQQKYSIISTVVFIVIILIIAAIWLEGWKIEIFICIELFQD